MTESSRRTFLKQTSALALGTGFLQSDSFLNADEKKKPNMKYGFVTYQWGKDWDFDTLLGNLEKSEVLGVELRTTHAHGVERDLNTKQREEVEKRFADSPVTLVGIGSNERFDDPDPAKVKQAIEATHDFIKLSHDVGGSGVKVKPNSFHDGVDKQKTIEQIGKSLNIVGKIGDDYGQQIRLEVHGQCAELPIMKQIMDIADHPNVAVCWNCNVKTDFKGEGLEHNFGLVADRMGATAHIHNLSINDYPYEKLFKMYADINYDGWLMLEDGRVPKGDLVEELIKQRILFDKLVAKVTA